MRIVLCALIVLISCHFAFASKDNEEKHGSIGSTHILVEGFAGTSLYDDTGGIRAEPTLGLDIGLGIPLNGTFLVEALVGYKIATSTKFDVLLHGPEVAAFIMMEPIRHFALGVGARGGLDWQNSGFKGGWLSVDGKIMVGFLSLFELGLQGGPRVAMHKDKNYWGGEIFAVGGVIF